MTYHPIGQTRALPAGGGYPQIPSCLDDTWATALAYCMAFPESNGPNATANEACKLARANPSWFSQLQQTPPCINEAPGPSEEDEEEEATRSALAIGGILLLLLAGGYGAYKITTRKRR